MPVREARLGVLVAVGAALLVGTVLACGTEAVGVDACKRIERVRCESAQACGLDLGRPVHRGSTPSENVGACIRYYEDACLHGLATTTEPGNVAVDACVAAIERGSCDVVRTPERAPECAFLIPPDAPPPVVEAGVDAPSDG